MFVSGATYALGNLGEAAKPYVKDILDILKDKTIDPRVRSGAARALANLGEASQTLRQRYPRHPQG